MDIELIVIATIVGLASGIILYRFIITPKETKIANFKEWLKGAVAEAENVLGSGTGQLKLRMVYSMAIEKFPWIATLIKFEVFSLWVDEALDWFKEQLDKNGAIKDYVEKK